MQRHRFVILLGVLLVLTIAAPTFAGTPRLIADFIPANAALYVELSLDQEESVQDIVTAVAALTNQDNKWSFFTGQALVQSLASLFLPQVSYEADIAPWMGPAIGSVFFEGLNEAGATNSLLILPALSPELLAEHRDALIASLPEIGNEGEVTLYDLSNDAVRDALADDLASIGMELDAAFAVLPNALLIGTEADVRAAIQAYSSGESLADTETFSRVWSQLPADAPVKAMLNGEAIRAGMRDQDVSDIIRALQIALRINPQTSEAEEALMDVEWFAGAGAAVDMVDGRIDITALAAVDATYPAPPLSSESAGSALLQYIPGDTLLVFDTYDMSAAVVGAGFTLVGFNTAIGPTDVTVGEPFEGVVGQLNGGFSPTPDATPTPLPTPTVDEMIAEQFGPIYAQVENVTGVPMDEALALLSGEYAFAMFPGLEGGFLGDETNGIGAAIWLQTSDPERVVQILNTAIENLAVQPGAKATRRVETFSNREVTIWGEQTSGDLIAYGVLSDDVVFISMAGAHQVVAQAALGDGVMTQSQTYPRDLVESYGAGQEALLFIDFAAMTQLPGSEQFAGLGSLVGTVDMQDDGVFVLRASLELAEEE